MNKMTIKERIMASTDKFTTSQKEVARYLLSDEASMTFKTANELAQKIMVSESTVIRFAKTIGFENYTQMQKFAQHAYLKEASFAERLTSPEISCNDYKFYENLIKQEADALYKLLTPEFYSCIDVAADMIEHANRIYVTGARGSASVASHIAFNLNYLKDNIISLITDSGDWPDKLATCSEGDLIIGICMPNYTQRTLDILSCGKKMGADVLAISDSQLSPAAQLTDCLICCESSLTSAFWSPSAAISVCNILLQKTAQSNHPEIKARLGRIEHMIKNINPYIR